MSCMLRCVFQPAPNESQHHFQVKTVATRNIWFCDFAHVLFTFSTVVVSAVLAIWWIIQLALNVFN